MRLSEILRRCSSMKILPIDLRWGGGPFGAKRQMVEGTETVQFPSVIASRCHLPNASRWRGLDPLLLFGLKTGNRSCRIVRPVVLGVSAAHFLGDVGPASFPESGQIACRLDRSSRWGSK